jgi:phage major head subunit gpT-like protein
MPRIITAALMADLFKNFNTKFTEGMQRGREIPSGVDPKYFLTYKDLALSIPSSTGTEVHAWLNQIPGFREWADDRQKKAIASQGMSVVNRDWEDTITVLRNDIEDDRFGLYGPLFGLMGAEAADDAIWLDMCIEALEAGSADKWVDGLPFFSATRKYDKQTINNLVNAVLNRANFMTAWGLMAAFKGYSANSLKTIPSMLVVSPALFGTARILMESEKITESNTQIDNPCRGLAAVKMHPGLAATSWYVLGVKGGMKAVASQRRREAVLTAKDQVTDDNVFFGKEIVYGADLRGESFLTFPHLAIKGQ